MTEKWLRLDELADAGSVSSLTLRREIARGRLTAVRIGSQLRVAESEWTRYIASRSTKGGK